MNSSLDIYSELFISYFEEKILYVFVAYCSKHLHFVYDKIPGRCPQFQMEALDYSHIKLFPQSLDVTSN